ncbi:probable E3 ubiquitin-protein ligase HERC6 [Ambystoma mexicanum]|uniref:probable E3 ubiquitin-protein ligase HERC6 n=1 Tax=Ambystoma mexicanum TaxID=8296 RepID=UPI0037E96E70
MYCWGDGWCGQLGARGGEKVAGRAGPLRDDAHTSPGGIPFEPMDPPFAQEVLQVACGERHSLFLLKDGTLCSCGDNSKGQLGRKSGAEERKSGSIQALEAHAIARLSCGKEHSLAVCSRGRVFAWGAGSQGQLGIGEFKEQCLIPKRLEGLSSFSVIQVACGHFHSIALSRDGRVFSWGQNRDGQLGLAKKTDPLPNPQPITSLNGVPLAQISAGGSHSFALCHSGTVFAWGKNSAGQLGFNSVGATKGQFRPHAVEALRDLSVIYISCGDEHTAVLTMDGSVYTFGDDTYGQLGHDPSTKQKGPQKIHGLSSPVTQISCGSYHTLVYSYVSRKLISFGHGSQRNMDTSATSDSKQPLNFDISSLVSTNDLLDLHVKHIFAGPFVSFASTVPESQICAPANSTIATKDVPYISKMNRTCIKRWMITSAGSKNCQEAKREITEIFSSAACLTASFLKQRSSTPFQASYLDVDLQAARKTFADLSKINWISSMISYTLRENLIPQLQNMSSQREALPIFLILPECPWLNEKQGTAPMVCMVANAVNNLSESSLKTLEKWWISLAETFLKRLVEMLKGAIRQKLLQTTNGIVVDRLGTNPILEMLKKLFKANTKANFTVDVHQFHINEINQFNLIVGDIANWHTFQHNPEAEFCVVFCRYPFTLNLLAKLNVITADAAIKQQAEKLAAQDQLTKNRTEGRSDLPKLPFLYLKLKRSNLVEDTFYRLSCTDDCDLIKELLVQFSGEAERGAQAMKREFFLYLFDTILDPDYGLFIQSDKYSDVWFPAKPTAEKKKYFFCGVLCGLLMYNYCVISLPLPLALFKKLLDKKPTLVDLKELDPVLARSLKNVLDCEHDADVKELGLYFSASWDNTTVDLVPHGSSVAVDNTNKHEYVNKYVDYIFNTSVAGVFEEFKRGYYKVCTLRLIKFFQPVELCEVMRGTTDYEWSKLEQNALYWGAYHSSHLAIKMFWKVFHELSSQEKKDFLLFVTGIDRVPVYGMDTLQMRISSLPSLSEQHLPEAQPCNLALFLPRYSTAELLKEKLLLAIRNNRGFFKTS